MIYLMRHGQDDETYVGGWSDVSLLPEGREEVKESAIWMKDNLSISQIMCSDVHRAVESTMIVSEVLKIPYELNPNLREQNKGLLNGIPKIEAYNNYSGFMDGEVGIDTVFPEGESLRGLYERMKVYLNKIMEMDDGTLLVTHRGVINMIYFLLNHKELSMDKKQFGVSTASVHEIDKNKKIIKKIR